MMSTMHKPPGGALILYLDVSDLGDQSAWLLRPDLDVVERLWVQPEVFPSLLLDVGDLRAQPEGFLVLYLDMGDL